MARIVTGTANCRDLTALAAGCIRLPEIQAALSSLSSPMLHALCEQLDPLTDLKDLIDHAIVDEPPFTVREGGMIRDGYSPEIDHLRGIMSGGKGTLAAVEAAEKEKTGIKNLRVGYNRVFGYYIEISKSNLNLVPDSYIRKQTLTNCERFITQELKDLESTILTAKDRINIIMDVSTVLSSTKTHVSSMNARSTPDGFALLSLDIDVPDSEQLRTVMRRLEQISGVMRVTRPAG